MANHGFKRVKEFQKAPASDANNANSFFLWRQRRLASFVQFASFAGSLNASRRYFFSLGFDSDFFVESDFVSLFDSDLLSDFFSVFFSADFLSLSAAFL